MFHMWLQITESRFSLNVDFLKINYFKIKETFVIGMSKEKSTCTTILQTLTMTFILNFT